MFKFSNLAKSLQNGAVKFLDSHAVPAAAKLDNVVQRAVPIALNHLADAGDLVSKHARRMNSPRLANGRTLETPSTMSGTVIDSTSGKRLRYILCAQDGCVTKIRSDKGLHCSAHVLSASSYKQIQSHTEDLVIPDEQKGKLALDVPKSVSSICKWRSCNKASSPEASFCSNHLIEYGAYRQRKCGKKEKHRSLANAERHVQNLESQDWQSRGSYNIYECEFCGARHVGHVKKREWEMQ